MHDHLYCADAGEARERLRLRSADEPCHRNHPRHDPPRAPAPGVPPSAWSKGGDEPDTYRVVEVYRDVAAQAAHMATDWVRDSLPKSAQLIDGKPDIKQYVVPGCDPVTRRLF